MQGAGDNNMDGTGGSQPTYTPSYAGGMAPGYNTDEAPLKKDANSMPSSSQPNSSQPLPSYMQQPPASPQGQSQLYPQQQPYPQPYPQPYQLQQQPGQAPYPQPYQQQPPYQQPYAQQQQQQQQPYAQQQSYQQPGQQSYHIPYQVPAPAVGSAAIPAPVVTRIDARVMKAKSIFTFCSVVCMIFEFLTITRVVIAIANGFAYDYWLWFSLIFASILFLAQWSGIAAVSKMEKPSTVQFVSIITGIQAILYTVALFGTLFFLYFYWVYMILGIFYCICLWSVTFNGWTIFKHLKATSS
eukprot:TRINITY_DN5431_c0_g1_i4.p1 TRINITY_DN5431_c0_g1~~TRINITY_DN5431_c0_g1_i4.p1  ORF type:complete len:298 (-),score=33.10 TRINITY_DN5431_c0_g1_i4:149-1042(-)